VKTKIKQLFQSCGHFPVDFFYGVCSEGSRVAMKQTRMLNTRQNQALGSTPVPSKRFNGSKTELQSGELRMLPLGKCWLPWQCT